MRCNLCYAQGSYLLGYDKRLAKLHFKISKHILLWKKAWNTEWIFSQHKDQVLLTSLACFHNVPHLKKQYMAWILDWWDMVVVFFNLPKAWDFSNRFFMPFILKCVYTFIFHLFGGQKLSPRPRAEFKYFYSIVIPGTIGEGDSDSRRGYVQRFISFRS